jgi:hypothetical protein
MKFESNYTSLEQYQKNPPNRNNEKKFQKKKLTPNDKSLEVKNNSSQKIEVNSFHSVNYPTTKQQKNSKKSDHILIYGTNRTNNSINKDITIGIIFQFNLIDKMILPLMKIQLVGPT